MELMKSLVFQVARTFEVSSIPSSPGTFINDTSQRTVDLPTVTRKNYQNDYYVYDVETINEYVNGQQDGIYYLSILSSSV